MRRRRRRTRTRRRRRRRRRYLKAGSQVTIQVTNLTSSHVGLPDSQVAVTDISNPTQSPISHVAMSGCQTHKWP